MHYIRAHRRLLSPEFRDAECGDVHRAWLLRLGGGNLKVELPWSCWGFAGLVQALRGLELQRNAITEALPTAPRSHQIVSPR